MSQCVKCGHDPDAKVTASWSFFVEKQCHSLNARIVNGGAKWKRAQYRKERDEWFEWMRLGQRNCAIPVADAKRRVRLLRVYTGRQRAYDVDGYVGGQKPVLDAMVLAGLIGGDAAKWVDVEYLQRRGGPNERGGLWVFVEEMAARSLDDAVLSARRGVAESNESGRVARHGGAGEEMLS